MRSRALWKLSLPFITLAAFILGLPKSQAETQELPVLEQGLHPEGTPLPEEDASLVDGSEMPGQYEAVGHPQDYPMEEAQNFEELPQDKEALHTQNQAP